jgi:hypothetical protein
LIPDWQTVTLFAVEDQFRRNPLVRKNPHLCPAEGVIVEMAREDSFVVYARPAPRPAEQRQLPEKAVKICSTYEEARRFCQGLRRTRFCVIRYVGDVGGGD